MKSNLNNVAVLIDGFNFYHAISKHMKDNNCSISLKWLDYNSLIRNLILKNINYNKLLINFYTAVNNFKTDSTGKPHLSTLHHNIFCEALKSTNINVIEGIFKIREENLNTYVNCKHCSTMQFVHRFNVDFPNKIYCSNCNNEIFSKDIVSIKKVEEKKTDVKIAIDLINIARDGIYNKIYLFSTDSDYIPAAEYIKNSCKNVDLTVVAPADKIKIQRLNKKTGKIEDNYIYRYGTSEFQNLGINIFRLRLSKLANHLFNDNITLTNGKILRNPWI